MKNSITTGLLILISFLSVCAKGGKHGNSLSQAAVTSVYFTNFSQHEMDSVIVKLYLPGGNFTNPVDSFLTTVSGQDSFYRVSITSEFPGTESGVNFSHSSPDIILYLPGSGASFRISNISFKPELCEHCKSGRSYVNFIDNYFINGKKQTDTEITVTK